MLDISEYFTFQQDNAPAHRAKATVDLLSTETQVSSCQHSGRLTVRIWIRLVIKSRRYFRRKYTRWR